MNVPQVELRWPRCKLPACRRKHAQQVLMHAAVITAELDDCLLTHTFTPIYGLLLENYINIFEGFRL